MATESPKGRVGACMDPPAVIGQAQQALAEQSSGMPGILSPILPGAWPPAGEPVAVLYAYVRNSLPTGTERWQVMSPFMRLEIPIADTHAKVRVGRLEARPLGVEGKPITQATPDVIGQAAAPLLWALCARAIPATEEAKKIRAAYRAWIVDHASLADELRRTDSAFLKWIEVSE